jgi:hypothetical protein
MLKNRLIVFDTALEKIQRETDKVNRVLKSMQTGVAEPIITFEECMKTYQPSD